MSTVKEQVIRLVRSLPDDCTLEDIRYHLHVRAKVERGLRTAEEGHVVSQEEAEARVREWVAKPPSG